MKKNELEELKRLSQAANLGQVKVAINSTCSGAWPTIETEEPDEHGDPYEIAKLGTAYIETTAAREGGEMPGGYNEKPERFELYDPAPLAYAALITALVNAAPELIDIAERAASNPASPAKSLRTNDRAILYTDTVQGKQTMRDDLWACSSAELIALERAASPAPVAAITDMSARLRETADQQPGWRPLLTAAADEIERYYGGMMNWKRTAEAKDADIISLRAALAAAAPQAQAVPVAWLHELPAGEVFSDWPSQNRQICWSEAEAEQVLVAHGGTITALTAAAPTAPLDAIDTRTEQIRIAFADHTGRSRDQLVRDVACLLAHNALLRSATSPAAGAADAEG